jgi:hypothetical protein
MQQCNACQAKFDALEYLSDNVEEDIPASHVDDTFLVGPKNTKISTTFWLVGSVAGILLLTAQIIYFEGKTLAQKPVLRPWLEKACQRLHCQLPPYRNLDELQILTATQDTKAPGKVIFNIVLTNQADFPQLYPKLKLKLVDYRGKIFAERVFSTDNYHPSSTMLKPGQTVNIQLSIVKPDNPVAGFSFSLM